MKQKRRAVIQLVLLSAALFAGCGRAVETDNTEPNGTEEVLDLETVSDETEIAEQVAEEDPEGTPAEAVLIKRVTRHEGDGTTVVDNYEEYDKAGNLIRAIRYREDGSFLVWFENEYDAFGNRTKMLYYNEDGSISSWFTDEYDAAGKWTKRSYYGMDGNILTWTEYEYDSTGNLFHTTKFDENGSIVSWSENDYDTDGNLSRCTYYNGDGSFDWGQEFAYDSSGNLLTKTSYNRDGDISERSENTYDSYGNLITESWYSYHEDGSLFEWYEYEYEREYDNNTEIISCKSDGRVYWRTEREYDQSDNLIKSVTYHDGAFINWDEYEYDELGRQIKYVRYYEDGSIDYWYEYEYLNIGQAPAGNMQETDNYIENYNVDRYYLKGSNNSSLYEVTYQIFEGYDTEEMLVDFIIVAELENGMLYKMQIEDLSVERFPVYLYETDEKIYRLWDFSETDIVMEEDELIQNAIVVCQDQEMQDPLSEEEQGEHHYILVEGDKCESHYYQYNDQANVVGYWEAFYWEEGKGLIQYRSGFSALADLVEMTKVE